MSLRYRGAGLTAAQLAELGKVLIDSADTTADFLSPKLLVTSNLLKTIQNIAGDENILLDVNLTGIEATLDGRYIKRSPSGENQTIEPLTNNIPLTIMALATQVVDILQAVDATGQTAFVIHSTGNVVISPGGGGVSLTLGENPFGNADILDMSNATGVQVWATGAVGQTTIKPTGLSAVPLTLKATALGSAALDVQDSTGTDVLVITRLGALVLNIDTSLARESSGILKITTSLAATLAQLAIIGTEASAAELRIRENAGLLEITDTTPTVLRSVVTRGAPNVAIAHNAVSVAVSFGTSEPDTNYEITVVPAYNTTVWYTLKANTGFTVNFGTAGPVGGSTFDWHIERIPRT